MNKRAYYLTWHSLRLVRRSALECLISGDDDLANIWHERQQAMEAMFPFCILCREEVSQPDLVRRLDRYSFSKEFGY